MSALVPIETSEPGVVAWCVTPRHGRTLHRFYDTSPISPSGRYLVVTQLPYDDRLPVPRDRANIVLVDLHTGDEQIIATTAGWDSQLGAQAQWGLVDHHLFYADVIGDDWSVVTIKHDIMTGERQILQGPLYMLSPNGKTIASPDLKKVNKTQVGYGVHVPDAFAPDNQGAPGDDGVYLTEVDTGASTLFLTVEDLVHVALGESAQSLCKKGDFYFFHVKWNPAGTRLMIVLRWRERHGGGAKNYVTTVRVQCRQGRWTWSDPCLAVPAELWSRGGHHPNWCPDGNSILMNLKPESSTMQLCLINWDGDNLRVVAPSCRGSGHPTMHPNGQLILTDCYRDEGFTDKQGNVPLRLISVREDKEKHLLMLNTHPKVAGPGNAFRIDPHPAWDRTFKRVVFNGVHDGERRVLLADLSGILA